MKHLKFIIITLLSAFFMALLEIQIEGSLGWAGNLPTWKISLPFSILGLGTGNKPITGYHLYLWLFAFILPHFSFVTKSWTIKKELFVISFYIFFTTLEGILWFVLNPAYGWNKFAPQNIIWYEEPWLLLPVEYWIRLGLGFASYIVAVWRTE